MTSHAVAWAALAKAGDAAIDDLVVDRPHGIVAEAKSFHNAGPELLNQHVGPLQKRRQPDKGIGSFEINGDRAFAAIQQGKIGAIGAETWLVSPHFVAAVRTLDLDDHGTGLGEKKARQRSGQQRGKINNLYACKRLHNGAL
jgi:hypothetical protein